ncbi:MAG: beta-lactamase class [Bacillota bacterium]|nr:beta-lactamase class [Bacillota bacterium]MDK2855007.1 beta-lactamase class [Bacillota bacterium]MDK2924871.1 beta-lactamase class [Bacillota bacterium]
MADWNWRRKEGWHPGWYLVAGALFALGLAVGMHSFQLPRGYYKYGPDPLAIPGGCDELKVAVQEYIRTKPGTFGIYFWDLKTGAHFGINETVALPAASSIKVVVALYLYNLVAEGKLSLDERMAYDPELDYEGGAGVIQFTASPGQTFTLRELASLMIRVSDNIAWHMLTRRLGKENLKAFMRSLGGKTVYPDDKNFSTAEDLSTYMRAALDFAERNPDVGGLLIDDLTHSIYKDGLPALLPEDIRVAHKVGALPAVANDTGIVFLPNRPYILTVMTKDVGASENPGFQAIGEISRIVYDYQTRKGQAGGSGPYGPGQGKGL